MPGVRISIIGATGYVGAHVAREAVDRGHKVTGLSRSAPSDPIEGVRYVIGSATDDAVLSAVIDGSDVVVEALSPRGDMTGRLLEAVQLVAGHTARAGARFIAAGGAGALHVAAGGPRLADGDAMPPSLLGEARETASVASWLEADAPNGLDWTYISPAVGFGQNDSRGRTGEFTFGGDVVKPDGVLSAADLGAAIVTEIEDHLHSGHVSVFS